MTTAAPKVFRVRLPAFSGPLDLLLHLVREKEVDLFDIPIGVIADAFLERVKAMPALDMEEAGEFLVVAATLLEIKARMLLPRDPDAPEGEEDDPRWELIQKLLEYRRFKDAAAFLEARAEAMALRWGRGPEEPPEEEPGEPDLPGSREPYECFRHYARIVEALSPPKTAVIRANETPLEELRGEVLALCPEEGGLDLSFGALYAQQRDKVRVVGLFLAVLELARLGMVSIWQEGLFGPVKIAKNRQT